MDNFVILPKNKKTKAARLLTYSSSVKERFARAFTNSKMGSMKMDLADSEFCDIVCQSGLVNPDYRGWLLDVITGQRKWCVVADMLFCMFNDIYDEKPMKTLLLPGHEIKGIVYNSAKRGAFPETSHGDHNHHSRIHRNTISGQNRYQFVIENQCTQDEHVFGAISQDELDLWMSILKVATNLDTDLFDSSSDSDKSSVHSASFDRSSEEIQGSKLSSANLVSKSTKSENQNSPTPNRYRPSIVVKSSDNSEVNGTISNGDVHKLPATLSKQKKVVLDESDLVSNGVSTDCPAVVWRGDRYHPTPPLNPKRLENNLSRSESNDTTDTEQSKESGPVFSRIIRCNSCREFRHNVSLSGESTCKDAESTNPKVLKRQSSFDNIKAILRRKLSDREPKESKSAARFMRFKSEVIVVDSRDVKPLAHSLPSSPQLDRFTSPEAESSGLRTGIGSRLAQKANSIKDRMFGSRSKLEAVGNARLGSLLDIHHSGFLQHKHLLKWVRVWCVVSNGYFYSYRSCFPAETPITSVMLKDCSLSMDDNDKSKKAYSFKLCQLNVRGLYFASDDPMDFTKWVDVLTKETSTYESFQHGVGLTPRESIDYMTSGHSSDSQESGQSSQTPSTLSPPRSTVSTKVTSEPLKIRIPVSNPKPAHKGPIRANSQNSFFEHHRMSTSSPKSVNGVENGSQDEFLSKGSSPQSPSYIDGMESGFSSWTENHLRGSCLATSHASQDSLSLSLSPGQHISDTDSDYPDSTFEDDITTPESITSASLTSSMTSPRFHLSYSQDSSTSPRRDNIKINGHHCKHSKDQGSQLSLLKSQVVALPDKPTQAVFNKALNNQLGESLDDSKPGVIATRSNGLPIVREKTKVSYIVTLRVYTILDKHCLYIYI